MTVFARALVKLMLREISILFQHRGKRNFSRLRGPTFTVQQGGRGALRYRESGNDYLISVPDGGGYSIVVEEMGDADLSLNCLPVSEKVRIAKNIRDVLLRAGVSAEVVHEHRILAAE